MVSFTAIVFVLIFCSGGYLLLACNEDPSPHKVLMNMLKIDRKEGPRIAVLS